MEKQIYPSIINIDSIVGLADDEPLPRLRVCSSQDLDIGLFLVDQGHTIFLLEFYKEASEEEEDLERRLEDDPEMSDSKETKTLTYKFLDVQNISQERL